LCATNNPNSAQLLIQASILCALTDNGMEELLDGGISGRSGAKTLSAQAKRAQVYEPKDCHQEDSTS
jgi:hypothetical protein